MLLPCPQVPQVASGAHAVFGTRNGDVAITRTYCSVLHLLYTSSRLHNSILRVTKGFFQSATAENGTLPS